MHVLPLAAPRVHRRHAWNHTLSRNIYRWSKTSTAGGTPYPSIGLTWAGAARPCLSCHDASVAIGDIAWFNGRSWGGRPLDNDNHNGDNVQIGSASGNLALNHPFSFPYRSRASEQITTA